MVLYDGRQVDVDNGASPCDSGCGLQILIGSSAVRCVLFLRCN
jgi:hypothetical protein